jgi:hypothetical protein
VGGRGVNGLKRLPHGVAILDSLVALETWLDSHGGGRSSRRILQNTSRHEGGGSGR